MGFTSQSEGFVKSGNHHWVLLIAAAMAIVVIVLVFPQFYNDPGGLTPSWAPDGCRVYERVRGGARIVILVSDTENFNTEPEIAAVILLALNVNDDFFLENPDPDIRRRIDIEFPSGTPNTDLVLQYMEVTSPELIYNTIIVRRRDENVFESRYVNEEILQDTALGNNEIGFLEWVMEPEE